jgi:hypothetical protein
MEPLQIQIHLRYIKALRVNLSDFNEMNCILLRKKCPEHTGLEETRIESLEIGKTE